MNTRKSTLEPRRVAGTILASMDLSKNPQKDQTLTRIAHALEHEHRFPLEAARDAAAAAIADHESKDIDGVFDLSASTDSCLFVNIEGVRRAVTLADIVANLEFQ